MQDIGVWGEQLVAKWLEMQNHDLLQQNWRCRWGEIDIIAQDRVSETIIFVEVKTRSRNNWDENGLLTVDSSKQDKIITTASLFLAKYPLLADLPCRFDVALVSYKKHLAQRRLSPIVWDKEAEKKDAKIDFENINITSLDIGQPVSLNQYQLTIENYLQSAFELP
jgi:putative endonuclease